MIQSGWTPLHKAAEGGYLQVVKFLLSIGAELDSRTQVSSYDVSYHTVMCVLLKYLLINVHTYVHVSDMIYFM